MEILFAFLGAILGGVITVQYMYVSDRLKFRGDVMVEVVAYCDNVYQLIQEMHALKNAFMANNLSDQMSSEYGAYSNQVSVLLKTSAPHTRVAIAYGEGKALADLNRLRNEFRDVVTILRKASPAAWANENKEIFSRFGERIDPLRVRLQQALSDGARTRSIWQILFRG